MNAKSDDLDLHVRFHELRDEVSATVPPFAPDRSFRKKRPLLTWRLATVGITTLFAVLLWTTSLRRERPAISGFDMSDFPWMAPSDYLLETPGSNLLRAAPILGTDAFMPILDNPAAGVTDTSS